MLEHGAAILCTLGEPNKNSKRKVKERLLPSYSVSNWVGERCIQGAELSYL